MFAGVYLDNNNSPNQRSSLPVGPQTKERFPPKPAVYPTGDVMSLLGRFGLCKDTVETSDGLNRCVLTIYL